MVNSTKFILVEIKSVYAHIRSREQFVSIVVVGRFANTKEYGIIAENVKDQYFVLIKNNDRTVKIVMGTKSVTVERLDGIVEPAISVHAELLTSSVGQNTRMVFVPYVRSPYYHQTERKSPILTNDYVKGVKYLKTWS